MILVVAAVVVDDLSAPSQVLAARRRTPPALAGCWELPGGKVEPGEDPVAALHRELAEELGIPVDVGEELRNPAGPCWPISAGYEMRVWFAVIRAGDPQVGHSHDEVRWLGLAALGDVDWLPADTAVVAQLRRPWGREPGSGARRAGSDR